MNYVICAFLPIGLILQFLSIQTRAQTRYACLQGKPGFSGGFFSSQSDDDDSHSSEDLMSPSSSTMTGTLGCGDVPGTRILVSKVIHGTGGPFASCGSPNEFCDDVLYSNSRISVMCDRKIRCFPSTTSKLIPHCGTSSNFIHVEYECVNPWSVFDICHDSSTNVLLSTLFITSPKTRSGASTCECIIKGKVNGQITLDYVQSNTDRARCDTNYLLVESKSSGNQTAVNKQNNICGRRTVTKDVHQGSVRLTYGTKSAFLNDGFLAKIAVPDGASHEVSVQCGAVFSEQDQQAKAQGGANDPLYRQMGGYFAGPYGGAAYNRFLTTVSPFQNPYYDNNSTQGSGRNAARASGPWAERGPSGRWGGQRHRPPYWDRGYNDGQRYGPRNYPPYGPEPVRGVNSTASNSTSPQGTFPQHNRPRFYPPATVSPFWRFMRQRRHRNLDLFAEGPMSRRWGFPQGPPLGRWPQNKGPPSRGGPKAAVNGTKSAQLPTDVEFIGNSASRNTEATNNPVQNTPPHVPQAHVSDDVSDEKFPTEAGRLAAYIIGGTGAVLSAVGGVVMVMLCSRRKKRNASNSNEADSQANAGPIYSLPTHNLGRVHVNAAYVSDGEGSEGGWSELDLDEPADGYTAAYTSSRVAREDRNATATGSGVRPTAADLSSGTVLGISNLACPNAGEASSSGKDTSRYPTTTIRKTTKN
ncbi:uncharacterized protein LOC110450707 isoform X2 [Mizuhopecten yessoensis]|uniref:uncharacterized protein LOC110450707 isoform X2 n=1 Tax=Mizuhopecten yessoensis TaxID=6573 RepID=UPI000B45845B|nr:uncharacterized protein LOC110450707 isoform X2 [Mizuhopecten yessoensis]